MAEPRAEDPCPQGTSCAARREVPAGRTVVWRVPPAPWLPASSGSAQCRRCPAGQHLREVASTCGRIAAIAKQALRDAPAHAAWIAPHADLRERALREDVQPANAALVDAVDTLADPALDSFGRLHRQLLQSAPLRVSNMKAARSTAAPTREPFPPAGPFTARSGMACLLAGTASRRSEMATVLLGLVRLNEHASELQGDGTAPDRSYRHMGLIRPPSTRHWRR